MYNLGSCSSMLSPALPLPRFTENTWQVVSPPTLRGRDKQTFADFVFGFASMFSRGKSAHMPARRAGKNIGLLSQPSNPPSFYTIFLYSLSPLFTHFPLFFFFFKFIEYWTTFLFLFNLHFPYITSLSWLSPLHTRFLHCRFSSVYSFIPLPVCRACLPLPAGLTHNNQKWDYPWLPPTPLLSSPNSQVVSSQYLHH